MWILAFLASLVQTALAPGPAPLAAPPAPPASAFVAPDGRDGGRCSRDQPCLTFDAAYRAARPGTSVEVAAGSYPGQVIRPDPAKQAGPIVTFVPAAGADVYIGGGDSGLEIGASHVEFRDMRMLEWYARPTASDVTLRNLTAGSIYITSAHDIRVLGGSVGPGQNLSPEIKAAADSKVAPHDILIDGVTFHDFIKTDADSHVDCLHVMAVDGLVIRHSRFRDCEHFAILFTVYGDAGSPHDITVESSFLQCCRSGYNAILFATGHGEVWRDILVRNVTSNIDVTIDPAATIEGNVRLLGNVVGSISSLMCGLSGVTIDYNVVAGGSTCGPHDVVGASTFADPAAGDFHLVGCSSPALGHADPGSTPADDIDRQPRPAGRGADAGADEVAC